MWYYNAWTCGIHNPRDTIKSNTSEDACAYTHLINTAPAYWHNGGCAQLYNRVYITQASVMLTFSHFGLRRVSIEPKLTCAMP